MSKCKTNRRFCYSFSCSNVDLDAHRKPDENQQTALRERAPTHVNHDAGIREFGFQKVF